MIGNNPRVCYFRGSYLNPFEIQYLEPLQDRYAITVGHTRSHRYDVDSITLPRIRVNCLDYLNGLIPRRIGGHHVPNLLKVMGFDDVILGGCRFASEFDIVHVAEQVFFSTWQFARAKQDGNFKLIVVQDEVNPFWYADKPLIRKRAKFVRNHADMFIARSERAKAALLCEGVSPHRIQVIGHGVDLDRFNPGTREAGMYQSLGIDRNRFVFLFVGNLLWTKGIFSIANAAKLLLEDDEIRQLNPLFVMVGRGGELGPVRKLIKTLGVENNFTFVGQQHYDRLPAIHRLADVFLLPSISTRTVLEQFGIAIIESMATEKPVVATHCGAIDEVVADAGILVQPNDYLRLHEALRMLLKNESLRQSLGRRALERVREHFSSHVISEKIAAAYRDVLAT